jgi:hypothetical protein
MQMATKEVKILCDTFRGTLVNVVKKEDGQPVKKVTSDEDTDAADAPEDMEITEETENDESF